MLPSLISTIPKDGPQVCEKNIVGSLSWQEANLTFEKTYEGVVRGQVKIAKPEDTDLTSSHGYTKVATICWATIHNSTLKTSRKYLLQLKI